MAPRTRRSQASPEKVPVKDESQSPAAGTDDSPPRSEEAMPRPPPLPLIKTTPRDTRMSYRIGRGEQGVLSFEPYKSDILPLWRFRTVPIARRSAADLWRRFEQFGEQGDFVGMDMSRKFIQMGQMLIPFCLFRQPRGAGFTRAKRYANHAGGRKYKKGTHEELPRSEDHADKKEKEEASLVFRKVWEQCKTHEVYLRLKEDFLKEQKEWEKMQ
ncbi:hypothetical protein Micbo1qcDRAFT_211559 [Microdochium bolleyi]|uniref:Uncharacterized protein n=1 Tax=Microdochium bolleyi TaxID=196109 RepID=A0A136JJJ1_9PEZI|nr:hypothetical protein Micbo1qcDRAFT_211559 [Microdochium bolleyi]